MPISAGLKKAADHAANIVSWTVAGGAAPRSTTDRADYEADWYLEQIDQVEMVRTVYGGTEAMRDAGEEFLPRYAAEDKHGSGKNYEDRLGAAILYNAFRRTVGGLVGMVMRKDVILDEDVPEVIVEHAENIDLQGRHLATFARDIFTAGMIDGHAYIHIEFPPVDQESVRTRAEERQAGVRPYWTQISKRDLINAKWEWVNGEPRLKLVVYRESASVDDGRFGQRAVERYRVLMPGGFEVWERDGEKDELALVEEGSVSLPYIPIVGVYVNREGLFRSCPPLLDLAHENIGHWQVRSDHRTNLKVCNNPMMFLKGVPAQAVIVGPHTAVVAEKDAEHADVKWLELTGASLQASSAELKDIEARMASLGLQMLVRETRAAETAEAKTIDKAESDSALATAARSLGDALENALQIHADYLNLGPKAGGSVKVNDDFRDQQLPPQMVDTLSNLVERSHISLETLWALLKQGEILPEDFDPDEERERIDTQSMEDLERFVAAAERAGNGNGAPPGEPPMEGMEPLE